MIETWSVNWSGPKNRFFNKKNDFFGILEIPAYMMCLTLAFYAVDQNITDMSPDI